MKRSTKGDALPWFDALEAATRQARELRDPPSPVPAPCLCGSTDARGRILAEPVDLTDTADDVSIQPNEGGRRCRGCQHYIPHGAMCVRRHYGASTTVRDYYHPSCVRL